MNIEQSWNFNFPSHIKAINCVNFSKKKKKSIAKKKVYITDNYFLSSSPNFSTNWRHKINKPKKKNPFK